MYSSDRNPGKDLKRILIVDLDRFSSLIVKMLSDDYATDTASDGLQAIRKLRSDPPDLILAEEKIPGGGLRFAEVVGMSSLHNHIPIILMSVSPSPDGILRARGAGVSIYLAKPFRPSELRDRIKSILSDRPGQGQGAVATAPNGPASPLKDNGKDLDIKDRIKHLEGLPPFPATHAEILELAKSDSSSSDDIAEKIQLDPGLLASVFKMVNSSCYGFRKKVDSLKLAVTLIGLEEIANLVMTAQVFKQLGSYEGGGGLDLDAFWKHSVGTAFVARAISKKLQTEQESSFLAGMLHDLGKIVLDRLFPDYYRAVVEQVQSCSGQSIYQAEQDLLGLTHADVGGQLATQWKFSDKYLSALLYHHDPGENRRYQRLTCLVHLADVICRQVGYGSGGDDTVPEIHGSVVDRFSLGGKAVDMLIELAREDLRDADSFLLALSR